MTDANWGELAPALDDLAALGVDPPETTRKVQAAMAALADESRFANPVPDTLAHLSADDLFAELDRFTLVREFDQARRNSRGVFQYVLATEAQADLVAHTDDILDQLRPAFTKAARVIVAAHKAGIRADHSDSTILHLGHQALDAWKAMPEAVGTLDQLASARLRLARATEQPPAQDQQSGAFSPASGVWNDRSLHHRWLALVDHGLQLNTVAETREACVRPRTPPIAPSNPTLDATPEPSGRWVSLR